MKLPRRQFLRLAATAVAVPTLAPTARAQAYPSRPVILVVPYGAGGPSDTIGRILAEGMRAALGQPVVVENAAGASGTIGVGRVARAAPDGYTFVLGGWATHVLNGPCLSFNTTCKRISSPFRRFPTNLS
jgi:tripartite-type tricarboxylate transporter receptor subunit TctC